MTPADLKACAAMLGLNAYWYAYTLCEAQPYGFGFLIWNGRQWAATRARLGLTNAEFDSNLPGELFGDAHLDTLAATLTQRGF